MQCERCNGVVTWRGPLSNLTHTQCESCGGINCQRVEYTEDDNIEERPTMTTPQQTLERAYAALNAAAFAHPSAADDIGTQCSEAAEEIRALLAQPAAAGQGEAATQDKLDSLLEAAQYLSHRRRVAAAPPATQGQDAAPADYVKFICVDCTGCEKCRPAARAKE